MTARPFLFYVSDMRAPISIQRVASAPAVADVVGPGLEQVLGTAPTEIEFWDGSTLGRWDEAVSTAQLLIVHTALNLLEARF